MQGKTDSTELTTKEIIYGEMLATTDKLDRILNKSNVYLSEVEELITELQESLEALKGL